MANKIKKQIGIKERAQSKKEEGNLLLEFRKIRQSLSKQVATSKLILEKLKKNNIGINNLLERPYFHRKKVEALKKRRNSSKF